MIYHSAQQNALTENGFVTIDNVFSLEEIHSILSVIQKADINRETFRKSKDIFAIRQILNEIPELIQIVFNNNLRSIIDDFFGKDYFAVKSIYFDKPETSNWYVAYHQDLTISVDKKVALDGFGPWTVKQDQFAVQPPVTILEKNFTIRIHLDDTTADNGALHVVKGSHRKGIYRATEIDWATETEAICEVPMGGVMIMKPLLLHSSGRTINGQKRRVLHIEFSDTELPQQIKWSELIRFG